MTAQKLTKSIFKIAMTCPHKLYYLPKPSPLENTSKQAKQVKYANKNDSNAFLQGLSIAGSQVGEFVKRASFRGGVEADDLKFTSSKPPSEKNTTFEHNLFNLLLANAQNPSQMKGEDLIIFEPNITTQTTSARIDIFIQPHLSPHTIQIVEVKGKSYNGDKGLQQVFTKKGGVKAGFKESVYDVAFQKFVFLRAFDDYCTEPETETETGNGSDDSTKGFDVECYLMLPDTTFRSTIPSINNMFKIFQEDSYASLDINVPPTVDLTLEKNLTRLVPVTDVVDAILVSPLVYPNGSGELSEVVDGWYRRLNFNDDETRDAPPLGAHCKVCEFRCSSTSTSATNSNDDDDNSDSNSDSNSNSVMIKSGFDECWSTQIPKKTPTTVLDLYNYRGAQKLIDSGIYRMSDIAIDGGGKSAIGYDYDKSIPNEMHGNGISSKYRNYLQVRNSKSPSLAPVIDKEMLRAEFSNFTYPLHLIDFETCTPSLPYHAHLQPYHLLAFQFSHHIIPSPGAEAVHVGEFLCATPGVFPNFLFIEELHEQMSGDGGMWFRWAEHERSVFKVILEDLVSHPDVERLVGDAEKRKVLIDFCREMIGPDKVKDKDKEGEEGEGRKSLDLMLLAKRAYYHPSSNGSSSIKKLLLPILRDSTSLKSTYSKAGYNGINFKNTRWWREDGVGCVVDPYKILQDAHAIELESVGLDLSSASDDIPIPAELRLINEGGAAANAYNSLQWSTHLTLEDRGVIERGLLRYCELDTLGMGMILEEWGDVVDWGREKEVTVR